MIYALVFLILLTNTSLGEMFRVPRLIHHYKEHVVWDSNDSFVEFIKKHYAKEINHPDDEHNDHENLPFKSITFHKVPCDLLVQHMEPKVELELIVHVDKKKLNYYRYTYVESPLDGIWQPPQFV